MRVGIIAVLVFGFVQWRAVDEIHRNEKVDCVNAIALRANQEIVLRTLVTLTLTLQDRSNVKLRAIPPSVIDRLETALANIPKILCT